MERIQGKERDGSSRHFLAKVALLFLGRSCPPSLVRAISLETRAGGRRTVLERRQQLARRQTEAVSALYGDFHKPAHQAFSCCHPSESALVWEVRSVAVPQGSPAFWPKGQSVDVEETSCCLPQ